MEAPDKRRVSASMQDSRSGKPRLIRRMLRVAVATSAACFMALVACHLWHVHFPVLRTRIYSDVMEIECYSGGFLELPWIGLDGDRVRKLVITRQDGTKLHVGIGPGSACTIAEYCKDGRLMRSGVCGLSEKDVSYEYRSDIPFPDVRAIREMEGYDLNGQVMSAVRDGDGTLIYRDCRGMRREEVVRNGRVVSEL